MIPSPKRAINEYFSELKKRNGTTAVFIARAIESATLHEISELAVKNWTQGNGAPSYSSRGILAQAAQNPNAPMNIRRVMKDIIALSNQTDRDLPATDLGIKMFKKYIRNYVSEKYACSWNVKKHNMMYEFKKAVKEGLKKLNLDDASDVIDCQNAVIQKDIGIGDDGALELIACLGIYLNDPDDKLYPRNRRIADRALDFSD